MNKRFLGGSAALLGSLVPMLSHAAADAAFTAAVTETTTNVGLMGAALVGVAAAGVAFGIAIKYVKRIRGAA